MLKNTFFLLLLAPLAFGQTPSRIVATDLTRVRQVGGITTAPDGKRAVYTVTSIHPTEEPKTGEVPSDYTYRTHLYLTNLQPGSAPKALTSGAESARQPTFSPDGQSVAFVRNVQGKSQVFILPLDGGEAWQLTRSRYSASNPVWSPDGKRLVYSVNVSLTELLNDTLLNPGKRLPAWSLEKPGFATNEFIRPETGVRPNPDGSLAEIRAYLRKDVEDKKAKVINRLNFQGEATTEPELSFSHLFVTDVKEGARAKPLSRGFQSYQAPAWLPDGSGLVVVSERDTLRHPDREQDNALLYLPADGSGRRQTLLAEAGRSFFSPELSPDGRRLALMIGSSQGVGFAQLAIASLNGMALSDLQPLSFDRAASGMKWAPAPLVKGKKATAAYQLYFTAPSNGGFPLYRYDPATKAIDRLSDFENGATAFGIAGAQVVFARTQVSNPSELYVAPLTGPDILKNAVKLSDHNDWVAGKALSFPEKRTYTNSKGQTVEYWIMKPTGLQAGRKYPLLLQMHGGPTAMWGPGEFSMWHELQFFCSQGYGIVYANPRGSGGYGQAFQRANFQDWGTGPTEDVLAAATDAARESWADTSRQVITGGSYAGYLTAWIIAHDNRFKAAFAQRGVYDLETFMGEGNAWRLVPNYFGGFPWQAGIQAVLDANSPITFVDKIKTPLLIKHGENDLRTGVIQSEMLYKSLKVLGRPVEYVRMPGGTHELSRTGNPRQRIDRILRIYEFFERYVGKTMSE